MCCHVGQHRCQARRSRHSRHSQSRRPRRLLTPVPGKSPHSITVHDASDNTLDVSSVLLVFRVFTLYLSRSRLHAARLASLRPPALATHSRLLPHQPAIRLQLLCLTQSTCCTYLAATGDQRRRNAWRCALCTTSFLLVLYIVDFVHSYRSVIHSFPRSQVVRTRPTVASRIPRRSTNQSVNINMRTQFPTHVVVSNQI